MKHLYNKIKPVGNKSIIAIDINGKRRYLPEKAWAALSPSQRAATNKAKAAGNKQGKQFVRQPKAVAQIAKRFRK